MPVACNPCNFQSHDTEPHWQECSGQPEGLHKPASLFQSVVSVQGALLGPLFVPDLILILSSYLILIHPDLVSALEPVCT